MRKKKIRRSNKLLISPRVKKQPKKQLKLKNLNPNLSQNPKMMLLRRKLMMKRRLTTRKKIRIIRNKMKKMPKKRKPKKLLLRNKKKAHQLPRKLRKKLPKIRLIKRN